MGESRGLDDSEITTAWTQTTRLPFRSDTSVVPAFPDGVDVIGDHHDIYHDVLPSDPEIGGDGPDVGAGDGSI
ncbi:hypothetical protein ACFXDJ_06430 [Streptomyces sp. NPDC059443]|uniref:hypothetical protein n=1 Tax=unclassified Streptomyces TaxID=2593676 RepID=UPI003699740A